MPIGENGVNIFNIRIADVYRARLELVLPMLYHLQLPIFFPWYRHMVLEKHRVQSHLWPDKGHVAERVCEVVETHLSLQEVFWLQPWRWHTCAATWWHSVFIVFTLSHFDRGQFSYMCDQEVEEDVFTVLSVFNQCVKLCRQVPCIQVHVISENQTQIHTL